MTMHPTTRIRFLGVAAYEILNRAGQRILLDPFLDAEPGQPGALGWLRQGRSRRGQPRSLRPPRRHRQDRGALRLPGGLRRRGQGLADGPRHPGGADPRHDLGHPGQGRGHRDPAARVPSLVADPAPGRQLHLGRADGLHRRSRRERALLPLWRHRAFLRPEAPGRALPADDRLHRHRQPAGDPGT